MSVKSGIKLLAKSALILMLSVFASPIVMSPPSVILPATSKLPPINTFLAIPTPPSTINAPDPVLVDCVVSFKFVIPVTSSVPLSVEFPVMLSVPSPVILPVATATLNVSLPTGPMSKFVPSNLKFASSSSSPLDPATTMRLFVKSSMLALANVA